MVNANTLRIFIAIAVCSTPTFAEQAPEPANAARGHAATAAQQGEGTGTLHAIDMPGKTVNLTHGPIPALKWMGMRMDLPVTRRVDLSGFQVGDDVQFTVKKGRDNQFRITEMVKKSDAQGGQATESAKSPAN
ncbi:MAG TPA: hypothetical protein DD979_15330 [Gammaproteobacteria bacterium]|nr:hypothetical protein [Gammaproteobacteria bacterium]